MSETAQGEPGPEAKKTGDRVVIKKYANRRLYNTQSSSYVTLEHLSEMVKEGVDFVVFDAKTNEDITRQVLTQIIFEAENSGQNLLPIQFLRQLIQLYGNQIQALVPGYLEMSLNAFASQQDRLREQVGGALGASPLGVGVGFPATAFAGPMFEEQVRQNMALFDRAMKMFTPFALAPAETPRTEPAAPAPAAAPAADESLSEMKTRLDEMQKQIERLAKKG